MQAPLDLQSRVDAGNGHADARLKRSPIPILAPAAVLCVACVFLLLPLPVNWAAGWRADFLNRMHVPLMAVCCVTFGVLFRASRIESGRAILWAALCSLLMAAVIEWFQPWFQRTSSTEDFAWGVAGMVAGSVWSAAGMFRSRWVRMGIRVSAVICMVAAPLNWLAQGVAARETADRLFPVLTGFPKDQARFLWFVEPVDNDENQQAGDDIVLGRDDRHGASARLDTRGRDWSGFGGLEIEATLETSLAVEVGVRLDLDDAAGTRIRMAGRMLPGRQSVPIQWPDGVSPRRVRQLVIFLPAQAPAARLRIHQLRLTRLADQANE